MSFKLGVCSAAIQKYGPKGGLVELEGERCIIRAGVTNLGVYFTHADQQDVIGFVSGMEQWPEQIRLVHGEIQTKRLLAKEW